MNDTNAMDRKARQVELLKTRDDHRPLRLVPTDGTPDNLQFTLDEECTASWVRAGETLSTSKLRQRIEPWLTALLQSEHLSVLLGSGLSQAVHILATGTPIGWMAPVKFGEHDGAVTAAAKSSAERAGRNEGNLEDQIRAANQLLRGLDILAHEDSAMKKSASELRDRLREVMETFARSILSAETGLLGAPAEARETAVNYLVTFLMSFASRTGTRDRVHLFTTNYDRYVEAGAELAGLHLLDRFVGSLAPVFRSSRLDLDMHYNPPGIRGEPRYLEGVARFTKLHGSVDWVDAEQTIRRVGIPFGVADTGPYLATLGSSANSLMIYPNESKDRETSAYPYVELFRDFAAAACRPNHTLIAFGYSFGDEHINRVIEDMLTIPSTHLVVISYDDPLGRIASTYERLGRHAQITLLVGHHLGDLKSLVDNYMPKPAIDRTTFKMAELLKSRFAASGPRQPAEGESEDRGTA